MVKIKLTKNTHHPGIDGIDGIIISFNKRTKNLIITGWYDGNCRLDKYTIKLQDFKDKLGIDMDK